MAISIKRKTPSYSYILISEITIHASEDILFCLKQLLKVIFLYLAQKNTLGNYKIGQFQLVIFKVFGHTVFSIQNTLHMVNILLIIDLSTLCYLFRETFLDFVP